MQKWRNDGIYAAIKLSRVGSARSTIRRERRRRFFHNQPADLCEFSDALNGFRFVLFRRCSGGGYVRWWPRFRRAFARAKLRDGAAVEGGIFEFERRLAGLHRDRKPPAQHRLVDRGRTSGERRTGGAEGAEERHVGPFTISGGRVPAGCAQRGL